MDPLTHAASGAVAYLAIPGRPATKWGIWLAALACAAPDLDLAFIHTPLEFLQLHRGISHSFAFAPIFSVLLALLFWPLWRKSTLERWSFLQVWLLCCAMLLLHIWLDVVTTYGTMVFLPFSHYRVRLNSVYMIDFLIFIPLYWALLRWRHKRGLILLTLLWIFIYPASGIAINAWHSRQCEKSFADAGLNVSRLHVLPDAFAPLFWRVIYEEDNSSGRTVRTRGLNFLGQFRTEPEIHPAAPAELVNDFMKISIDCDSYFHFAMLPVMQPLREEYRPEDSKPTGENKLYMFYDLRFGSELEFIKKLLAMRANAELPFLLMTELTPGEDGEASLSRIRLRFSDSGRDSMWHKPRPPQRPDWLQWLAGLR